MMIRKLALAVALSAAVFTAPATAYEVAGTRFYANGWTGYAHANDRTGAFTSCTVAMAYTSGHVLVFMVDYNMDFTMSVAHPSWRLPVGGAYPVAAWVDAAPFNQGTATVINREQVIIPLMRNEATFYGLQRASFLTLQPVNVRLSLAGSSAALDGLIACAARNGGFNVPATPRNPFNI